MAKRASCGIEGMNVHCGCDYHRAWVLCNPDHPDVVEDRARIIAWMADHPGINPATGRPMAHPDDYLTDFYGYGLTEAEAGVLELLVG